MGKPKEAAQLKRAAYRTSDFYAGTSKTDRFTAIQAAVALGMSVRGACKEHDVPPATYLRWCTKLPRNATEPNTMFSPDDELVLVEAVLRLSDSGFPIDVPSLASMVGITPLFVLFSLLAQYVTSPRSRTGG
jgi:hypothetical protein